MERKLADVIAAYPGAEKGVAVAFSGGVDSAVVLDAAVRAASGPVYAVFFSTALHPAGERDEAEALAGRLGAAFHVLKVDELREAGIENNPPDRCYRCKRLLFSRLRAFADGLGISLLLDGTNEEDLHEYRPGLRAVREAGVRSPLAEMGLRKEDVRELARRRGLAVAGKPSSPCLATRLEYGAALDPGRLEAVGRAEAFLKERGFEAVRVRLHRDLARIEVPLEDLPRAAALREEIAPRLRELGFRYVTLDLEGLRSGSMDLPHRGSMGVPPWEARSGE